VAYVLDITTTDEYQFLSCPGSTQITILGISNAAVLMGFGTTAARTPGGGWYPDPDEPFLPSQGAIYRPCDEIRVMSYTAGQPANVKLVAR
jgi:hypothetical protein